MFSLGGSVSSSEVMARLGHAKPGLQGQTEVAQAQLLTPYSSKYDVQQRFGMDFAFPRSGGDATELFP